MQAVPIPITRSHHSSPLLARSVNLHKVLNTLVNNLEGMAYRYLPDGHWTMRFVSQGCHKLTGYQALDLIDNQTVSWDHITQPNDRIRVRAEILAAVAAEQRFTVHYAIRTRSGAIRHVKEQGLMVVDEDGQQVLEGFIEDVTEGYVTLAALAHAEPATGRCLNMRAKESFKPRTQASICRPIRRWPGCTATPLPRS